MELYNETLRLRLPTKFQFPDRPDVVPLHAQNGLAYGPCSLFVREGGTSEDKGNGIRVYTNVDVILGKKCYDDNVGEYVDVQEKPIRKKVLAVDEGRMCYAEPYLRTTGKSYMVQGEPAFFFNQSNEVNFYDPNFRQIGDMKFYDKMVESYKRVLRQELAEVNDALNNHEDAMHNVFCYDFIAQFEGSKNPFEKDKKLTKEQKEEFLSFTDAMLKSEFVKEDYNYDSEYYTLKEIAHKYVEKELQK